jgi:arylsulfatase A-like enzyme/Flp pilus assembly protein TadD
MSRSKGRKSWPWLLAAAIAAGAYLWWTSRPPSRPNVLLVTVDTLRADRLGAYGYEAAATPNLDRMAREGVRFADAISHVPLTLPSHASILTGLLPAWHGIRDNGGYFLDASTETVAEVAKREGYATAAFVSAFVLDSKWGLDRGFDSYFDQFDLSRYERVSLGSVQRSASGTIDELLAWLGEPGGGPFFAWLHLYDPHTPYEAPEPFGSRFSERPYDGEVAYVDAELGRVFRFLEERGLDDATVVVLTSDHGEGLGEHGELTHGNFVYETTLRVPLLMKFPGGRHEGLVVEEPVGLADLGPTLAEILGAEPPKDVQGRSLLPLLHGERAPRTGILAESLYPRLHYGWSEVVALRRGRLKYIDTPEPELYDLDSDPNETRNVASERAGTVREMRDALRALEASAPEPAAIPAAALDPETERRLRALGYVGGGAREVKGDRSELSDPKEKIHLIHKIAEADELGAAGKASEAIALLESVIAEDDAIIDAYLSLGNKYTQLERHEDAIAAFRRCLELNPDYALAVTNLALSYRRAGRLDEAEVGFRRVQELDPENRQAFFNLGEIYLFQKRFDAALAQFRRGLELEKESPVFLRQAGIAYYYLHQPRTAETRLRESLEANPDVERVHFTLGLLYEQQGRIEEAAAEYRKEREKHPGDVRATQNLANLHGKSGRFEEQISLLEDALARTPGWADGHIQLAKAYRDTGRPELFEKALASADRGLALDPASKFAPLAHFLRAELLDAAGRPEEARRAFEKGRALAERR